LEKEKLVSIINKLNSYEGDVESLPESAKKALNEDLIKKKLDINVFYKIFF
jgi:hypothetical protein